jgi:SAM-dependent methyltransferase
MSTRSTSSPEASAAILKSIEGYYTAKVRRYGATALGVDWNSPMSQRLRFVQLLKAVDWGEELSLHDVGCGYGALLDHLADRHANARIRYVGSDLSDEMIRLARRRRRSIRQARFIVASAAMPPVDYSVASGIFNVKLDHPVDDWEQHVALTLSTMRDASRKGFAVNFMAPAALAARPAAAPQLYAADPELWMTYGREELGCDMRLVADYGLPEYSILARRPS